MSTTDDKPIVLRGAIAADVRQHLLDIRAVWKNRKINGSMTPVQAGDLMVKAIDELLGVIRETDNTGNDDPECLTCTDWDDAENAWGHFEDDGYWSDREPRVKWVRCDHVARSSGVADTPKYPRCSDCGWSAGHASYCKSPENLREYVEKHVVGVADTVKEDRKFPDQRVIHRHSPNDPFTRGANDE
jgi:hypothetical protein